MADLDPKHSFVPGSLKDQDWPQAEWQLWSKPGSTIARQSG
jgi:hypothetical protein